MLAPINPAIVPSASGDKPLLSRLALAISAAIHTTFTLLHTWNRVVRAVERPPVLLRGTARGPALQGVSRPDR